MFNTFIIFIFIMLSPLVASGNLNQNFQVVVQQNGTSDQIKGKAQLFFVSKNKNLKLLLQINSHLIPVIDKSTITIKVEIDRQWINGKVLIDKPEIDLAFIEVELVNQNYFQYLPLNLWGNILPLEYSLIYPCHQDEWCLTQQNNNHLANELFIDGFYYKNVPLRSVTSGYTTPQIPFAYFTNSPVKTGLSGSAVFIDSRYYLGTVFQYQRGTQNSYILPADLSRSLFCEISSKFKKKNAFDEISKNNLAGCKSFKKNDKLNEFTIEDRPQAQLKFNWDSNSIIDSKLSLTIKEQNDQMTFAFETPKDQSAGDRKSGDSGDKGLNQTPYSNNLVVVQASGSFENLLNNKFNHYRTHFINNFRDLLVTHDYLIFDLLDNKNISIEHIFEELKNITRYHQSSFLWGQGLYQYSEVSIQEFENNVYDSLPNFQNLEQEKIKTTVDEVNNLINIEFFRDDKVYQTWIIQNNGNNIELRIDNSDTPFLNVTADYDILVFEGLNRRIIIDLPNWVRKSFFIIRDMSFDSGKNTLVIKQHELVKIDYLDTIRADE